MLIFIRTVLPTPPFILPHIDIDGSINVLQRVILMIHRYKVDGVVLESPNGWNTSRKPHSLSFYFETSTFLTEKSLEADNLASLPVKCDLSFSDLRS